MKIDHLQARRILEEEAEQARTLAPTGKWVDRVKALSRECETKNKTMIAMLGTAMLAKATSQDIDIFSLQVGKKGEKNTYSARALCKEVLAADSSRLGIDLGVSGREPLNNQPFFGKPRVSRKMNVRSDARAALSLLVDILDDLQKIKTEKDARAALRAFLQVRQRKPTSVVMEEGAGDNLEARDLLNLVQTFVNADSESGRRAQAVAAGLLEVLHGAERIRAPRIHDPSRRFPGDIAILNLPPSKEIERVFEVRDKLVVEEDLQNLVSRAREFGVTKVAMLAVAENQSPFDTTKAVRWAETRQVRLHVYFGWPDLAHECLFWSPLPGLTAGAAYRAIAKRLVDLEVSEAGREFWRSVL